MGVGGSCFLIKVRKKEMLLGFDDDDVHNRRCMVLGGGWILRKCAYEF